MYQTTQSYGTANREGINTGPGPQGPLWVIESTLLYTQKTFLLIHIIC